MGRELQRGTEKIFRVMDMFIILVVLMVSQEHMYVKTHESVYCKYMLLLLLLLLLLLSRISRVGLCATPQTEAN